MEITVRLFASHAAVARADQLTVAVPPGATVGALRAALAPMLGALAARSLVAVNAAYANDGLRLGTGDEVALIPPVAGG